jgi:hypothetical protein
MSDQVAAPFTDEQVAHLNEFQHAGFVHPFTCGKCSAILTATRDGWICPAEGCDYTQDWAHDFMADGRSVTRQRECLRDLGMER